MKTLKQLRKEKKLTQGQAANMLAITKEYLSMLERGERNPSDKVKEKLAELYGYDIEYIFLVCRETKCLRK